MVEIRTANRDDAAKLAYIQTESWKSAFDGILSEEDLMKYTDMKKAEAMYERVLQNPGMHIMIGYVDEKPHCIAAWSCNRVNLGENVAELICIHSLPDKWHQGYGSIMMDYILAEIRKYGFSETILWVFEKNMRARKFYEKHGFTLTMEKQNSFGAAEVMYSKKMEQKSKFMNTRVTSERSVI